MTKHRLASTVYAVDFVKEIPEGEALVASPAPQVLVLRKVGLDYEDVSSEFIDAIGTPHQVVGTEVRFRMLVAADAAKQQGGRYRIRVEVATDAGGPLVSTHLLSVSERADTAAV